LIVPVLLLAGLFVREGISAAIDIQAAVAGGGYTRFARDWTWLTSHIAANGITVDLPDLVRQGARRAGEYMAAELGEVIRNIVVFIFELFVMLFALFYFLRDGDSILVRFRHLLPFEETMTDRMLVEARELIFASVTTSLVIAGVQGILCGGSFAIVGLGSPIFWGVVMGFLSLLPVVGAWPIWIPAVIWLFSTGHAGRAVILILICGVLGGMIDNILRPVLLGGRASLNGLLVFISVLGGIAVFGVLGVVLGPIVVATTVGILDVYSGTVAAETAPGGPIV
jgi:predicted PurR-regulated permease PerM